MNKLLYPLPDNFFSFRSLPFFSSSPDEGAIMEKIPLARIRKYPTDPAGFR
jgi:hypothetical protein